jgi:hypothetical protein
MKSLLQAAALLGLLGSLAGCNQGPALVPVKGVATRDGKPLAFLSVIFFPADDTRPSSGRTDEEGRFELKFDSKTKGAVIGSNKVVVAFRPRSPQEEVDIAAGKVILFHPDQDAILEKYGKRETTQMSVEVTSSTKDLELKFD